MSGNGHKPIVFVAVIVPIGWNVCARLGVDWISYVTPGAAGHVSRHGGPASVSVRVGVNRTSSVAVRYC